MSYELSENHVFAAGKTNHNHWPAAHNNAVISKKEGKVFQDTIEYGEETDHPENGALKNHITERVSLPAPPPPSANEDSKDVFLAIAKDFAEGLSAMCNSVKVSNEGYVQLQQLQQQQSEYVLKSTSDLISKQEAALKISEQISNYEKTTGYADNVLGWVMFAIGMVVLVASIASGVGAALAPEEGALMGADVADLTGEVAGGVADGVADGTADVVANEAESVVADAGMADQGAIDAGSQAATDASASATESTGITGKDVAKFLFKRLMNAVCAATLGSPMLMNSIAKFHISAQQQELAIVQKSVGDASATLQQNQMVFSFLQQAVRRDGGVVQEEVGGTGNIVGTEGAIFGTYRHIADAI